MSEGFNDKPRYDDRTSKGWPLPHWLNKTAIDARRLREILRAIDAAICEIESSAGDSSERLDAVETRLDVIVGQTTEDTEILDARVDAKNETHPNLGHNIRNLHKLIIELGNGLLYEAEEFRGLLRQFDDLAQAQIQGEINSREASERRKIEIQQEALTRAEHDNGLQGQIDAASHASINNALNLNEEATQRRKVQQSLEGEIERLTEYDAGQDAEISRNARDIDAETKARAENDAVLARIADANAEASIQNALNVQEFNERRKNDLAQEAQARAEADLGLARQADANAEANIRNALNLNEEATQRRKVQQSLEGEIERLTEYDAGQDAEISRNVRGIEAETKARAENDAVLARIADANAEASIQNALNVQEFNERRKNDLAQEAQARAEADLGLARQADANAEANIRNALNLNEEVAQRRKVQQSLNGEIQRLTEYDAGQDAEISRNARDIDAETKARAENDAVLARIADANAEASIQNALSIQQEADKRRELLSRLIQEIHDRHQQMQDLGTEIGNLYEIPLPSLNAQLAGLQVQANKNAEAEMLNALNLHDETTRRNDDVNNERRKRIEEDTALQGQLYTEVQGILVQVRKLAEAVMWLSVREYETQRKVQEIEIEAKSIPNRAATNAEFNEMLDDLYNE